MRNEERERPLVHRSGAVARRRAVAVLASVVVMAVAMGFLPGPAEAEYGPPGLNGAQIDLSDDGYGGDWGFGMPRPIDVTGTGFVPNDVAHIFECPEGAIDLRDKCLAVGAAPTDTAGDFGPTKVVVSPGFPTAGTPTSLTACHSLAVGTQCEVVAATFDTTTNRPTSKAQHYICFNATTSCKPKPAATTTTTTTNPPPGPEWEPDAAMAVARQHLATAVGADGRIYALGGHAADGGALNSAEVLDPCGDRSWSSLPPMPTPRTQFAAAAGPDGRIYAIGGRDSFNGTPLATVDAFDPAANTWSSVARLAVPRSDLAAATGPDGLIYAVGGYVGGSSGDTGNPEQSTLVGPGVAVPTVEAYDTATNQWALITPLSRPTARLGAATGPDERVYAITGGFGATPTDPQAVHSYGPGPAGTPGIWREGARPPRLSDGGAVTTGPYGLIYVVGGLSQPQYRDSARTVWVYDTATDTWALSGEALTTRRWGNGAATGRDGRIYAIGGVDYDAFAPEPAPPLASTEALEVGPNSCPPPSPPPTDFDGDGDTDISVFRPSTGTWFAKDGATSAWGADGDIPVPGDYDGDRITDVAIFRPSVGLWAIDGSAGADTFVTYGIATDVPIPADYDGDGRTDIAVYRPDYATWWVHRSSDGTDTATTFGLSTDVPVPGDYDGDGSADLGIFRDGTWFVQPASGGAYTATTYGIAGDVPVPGDYDSDGRTDMAVFRPSEGTWALHRSSDGADEIFAFGISGDVPVPGDYEGDWRWDPAVFRPSTGEWFIETGESAAWGTATDVALPLPYAVHRASFGGPS